MQEDEKQLTPAERLISLLTKIRPGEGRGILLFFLYAFLILISYYLLKTVREPLILTAFSAEVKSYAYATIAVLLFILVPLYGILFRHTNKTNLIRWITLFFIVNLAILYFLGRAGVQLGFIYYVWVSIFSVMMIAQFWAYAADTFNVKSGQRLFPVIMAGSTLGALAGPQLAKMLFPTLGPFNMMLVAAGILALTLLFVAPARAAVPAESRATQLAKETTRAQRLLSGFALIARDRYLLLMALMILLLNWVNTTGEIILSDFVVRFADSQISAGSTASKGDIIAGFYADFFMIVNLLTVLVQIFLVARLYRWIGVRGSVLVLPVIAFLGYGMALFIPIFSILRLVKILENSTDYSLMNTTRQALYLPLDESSKYEGKTAIDTFFTRFGDLIQAGAVYVGINHFGFAMEQFAALNMVLAGIWIWLAYSLGRHYQQRARDNLTNVAPTLNKAIPGVLARPGEALAFRLDPDTFADADPGDVLTLTASLAEGGGLPGWLIFDPRAGEFRGNIPGNLRGETIIEVRATDLDGLFVTGTLILRHEMG